MSEKRSWDQDFPKTPESFKLALKQQVEKEMANENDRSEDIKKMVEINPSNTKKKRRKWVKIAVAAIALISLMSGGVYAVSKTSASLLIGREVDELEAESYLTTDASAFNQTVTPGWTQTMVDIYGEERAAEVKGISEPLLTITQVYYDGLSLAFYARPTKAGAKYELGADRLVIGDAVYMIEFDQLPANVAENRDGVEKGDYKGTVQLGGREVPDHFTAGLVLGAGKHGTQTVSFDVQIDKNAIIKQKQTIEVSDGIQASVDALKIAESGAYIHVTWEFDESQKTLYDEMTGEEEANGMFFMALDDSNGNHFTTEEDGENSQTIVFTADGDDWSGGETRYYEANGKYYYETYSIIEGLNQDVTSLTVTPYMWTNVGVDTQRTYKTFDAAVFTVEYSE